MASAVRSLARFACAAEAPAPCADEPGSGRVSGARSIESPRIARRKTRVNALVPLASLASAARIDRLRRMLAAGETGRVGEAENDASLTLGIPLIDVILGGGLGWGALHEIAAA